MLYLIRLETAPTNRHRRICKWRAGEEAEPPGGSRGMGQRVGLNCVGTGSVPPSACVRVTALPDAGPAIVSFRGIFSCTPGAKVVYCPFSKVETRVHCRKLYVSVLSHQERKAEILKLNNYVRWYEPLNVF